MSRRRSRAATPSGSSARCAEARRRSRGRARPLRRLEEPESAQDRFDADEVLVERPERRGGRDGGDRDGAVRERTCFPSERSAAYASPTCLQPSASSSIHGRPRRRSQSSPRRAAAVPATSSAATGPQVRTSPRSSSPSRDRTRPPPPRRRNSTQTEMSTMTAAISDAPADEEGSGLRSRRHRPRYRPSDARHAACAAAASTPVASRYASANGRRRPASHIAMTAASP